MGLITLKVDGTFFLLHSEESAPQASQGAGKDDRDYAKALVRAGNMGALGLPRVERAAALAYFYTVQELRGPNRRLSTKYFFFVILFRKNIL